MKTFFVKAVQANLRYHVLPGDGVPLLFVHGLGCAGSCDYPEIAANSALAGRPMILVDLLGSGFSDRPADFGYSVRDHAGVIADLIQSLSITKLDVFGHSMGGAIAIELAGILDCVRSLTLAEPNLDAGGWQFSRSVAAIPEAEFCGLGFDAFVKSVHEEGNGLWSASLLNSRPAAVHREAVSLISGSWREKLYQLSIPRTVLFGALSGLEEEARQLQANGIVTAVVEGAGHSMPWDNPTAVAKLIAQAIARFS